MRAKRGEKRAGRDGRPTLRRGPTASLLALFLVSMIPLVAVTAACGGDGLKKEVVRGRTLEIHVTRPQLVDKLAFIDRQGQHRETRATASNRRLAIVNVTVVNRTATVIPIIVGPKSAQLGNRRGERINALDPVTQSRLVDTADPLEEAKYAPLLWGDFELGQDFQGSGWMVFEVPQGLTLGSFWWREVDDIIVDFIDYRRP